MALGSAATAGWLVAGALLAYQGEPPSPREQLAELLAAPIGPSPEPLVAALSALGEAVVPHALDALRDEALICGPEARAVPVGPAAAEALHSALRRLGCAVVAPELRRRLAGGASPEERALAVEVLSRIGTAADLGLALQAAELGPGEGGPEPRLVRALELDLPQLFRRDPSVVDLARQRLLSSSPHVSSALVRAIAASGSPQAFDTLARMLGYTSELDLALFPALARASGRPNAGQLDPKLRSWIAARTDDDDPMLRRSAVLAAGELGDGTAIPRLIALLEGPDRPLGQAAHWSLQRITGLSLPCLRERWLGWYAAEELWFRVEFPRCAERLRSRPGEVAAALQEIGSHRLERPTLATAVAEVLANPDPTLRALACSVLGQLRDPSSLPALRERSQDLDPRVAERAQAALRRFADERTGPGQRPPLDSRPE